MTNLELAIHIVDREKMKNSCVRPKRTEDYLHFVLTNIDLSYTRQVGEITNKEWQEAKSSCFPTHNVCQG
jgi:hypothetical protein